MSMSLACTARFCMPYTMALRSETKAALLGSVLSLGAWLPEWQ